MSYENPQGRRLNALAAYVPDGDHPSLTWARVPRTWTAPDLLQFLTGALPAGPGLRVVVLDNASMHRSRAVLDQRTALREQGIVLYFLPPYSPELNHIEPVFGVVKYHEMPERSYTTVDALRTAVDAAFATVEARLVAKCAVHSPPAA